MAYQLEHTVVNSVLPRILFGKSLMQGMEEELMTL
jgi:hypothetical protein